MRAFDFDYQVGSQPVLLPDAPAGMTLRDIPSGDAGEDEAGFYHPGVLRKGVRKWEFVYKVLSEEEYRRMTELLGGGSFLFRFRNPQGQPEQTLCYSSGCSAELFDRSRGIYKNVKFTVTEC